MTELVYKKTKSKRQYTKKEQKERHKESISREEMKRRRLEIEEIIRNRRVITRPYIMKELTKIYHAGEIETMSERTGIYEGHLKSYALGYRRPEGKDLEELQEYFVKN